MVQYLSWVQKSASNIDLIIILKAREFSRAFFIFKKLMSRLETYVGGERRFRMVQNCFPGQIL